MKQSGESTEARLAGAMELHRAGEIARAAEIYRQVLDLVPGQPDALHLLGVVALQQNRLEDAIRSISAAIAAAPNVAAYHANLGNAWRKGGAFDRAIACYDRALTLDPELLDARFSRGHARQAAGQATGAIEDYRAVLTVAPEHAEARNNLGVALLAAERPAEALAEFEALICKHPGVGSLHRNRAQALGALGRAAEAGAALELALELAPDDLETQRALATHRHAARRLDEAIELYRRIEAADPGDAQMQNDYAVALLERGRADLAAEKLQAVLRASPRSATAYTNYANAMRALGRLDRAVELYREALALDPTIAETYDNLATALRDRGQLDEAVASYEAALRLKPDFALALGNLANLQLERGEAAMALSLYRRALAIDPGSYETHRNLLLALLYDPTVTPDTLYAAHLEFARRHAPAEPLPPVTPAPLSGRRLRVGYMSSDLRDHPIARSLAPILAHHDRDAFETFVYSDVALPDPTTVNFRVLVEQWRDVVGETDRQVAERVRADGIDILVCVAGRFDHNRPLVAAWRPAPVQLAFGEAATTGMDCYDGIFADRMLVPRIGTERFAERPLRLPSYFIHVPLGQARVPGPPPSASGAGPVFGSFSNPVKVNDAVLDLWVRVLRETPGSRLLLKYKSLYAVPSIAARVRAAFVRGGVDPARADLRAGVEGLNLHLDHYDRMDVALDPFPFSGWTSSFEALWMGMPVVTKPGATMASRLTAAMLKTIGKTDWIARDADEFVSIAKRLAGDTAALAEMRANQRARIAASPLCDGRTRARQMERFYRAIWKIKSSGARR